MIVSNNTLLNILLPKDSPALKEALKEADIKSLSNNKGTNVQDILKNLVDNIKGKTQSNETVLNILKNSTVFKNMGSFPQQLNTLMNNLPKEAKFDNLKATLQSFLINIKDVDENNLKDLIQKSGIFLESKLAKGGATKNPTMLQLNTILTQIKDLIKNDSSPQAKQLNALIDKILAQTAPKTQGAQTAQSAQIGQNTQQNSPQTASNQAQLNSDIKSALTLLKTISNNAQNPNATKIVNLTQQLETLNDKAKLVESKVNNAPNLKTEATNLQQTAQETKLQQNTLKLEQSNINQDAKTLLTNLKSELLATRNPSFAPIINNIDNLLQTPNLFDKTPAMMEPKALVSNLVESPQLKNIASQQPAISESVNQLKGSLENIAKLESSILQNKISSVKIDEVMNQLKQNLSNLQTQLSELKNVDTKALNQLIDKVMNLTNLFSKIDIPTPLQQLLSTPNTLLGKDSAAFSSNFSNNISSLLVSLKSALAQSNPTQAPQQFEMFKSVGKLESLLSSTMNQLQNAPTSIQNSNDFLQTDMKSLLLQAQEELAGNSKFMEASKQIDKLLGQIDYYQLLSATSSSNFVYVPFLWDILDEGSISMKKSDEERYFCEIHLTLKELGNMDLLLSLYDKNSLDITVFANTDYAKEMIRDNLGSLKRGLNSIEIIPRNIKILDLKEEKEVEKQPTNVYTQNNHVTDINFGVDIKV